MKNRPLLFVILAYVHFFEPVMKIGFLKFHTGFEWAAILDNISNISTFKSFFEFWLLFPLAGAALMGAKKWCYPLFVSIQAYSIYAHLTYEKFTWPYVAETPFISHSILLIFNVLVILYFLLPDVRKVFFDPALRWWETPTRYYFDFPCAITFGQNNQLVDLKILNISNSGCFVSYIGPVTIGQPLTIHLTYSKYDAKLNGEVMRLDNFQGNQGIGVKFHFQNLWEVINTRRMLHKIDKIKAPAPEKEDHQKAA